MCEEECRVCVVKPGVLPIFGDEDKPDISLEIAMFGGIRLHENDDMPKYICEECFKLLECAVAFRKSAKHAEALLRRRKKRKGSSHFNIQNVPVKYEVEIQSETVSDENTNEIDFVTVKLTDDIKDDDICTNLSTSVANEVEIAYEADNGEDKNDNEMVMLIVSEDKKPYSCKVCNLEFDLLNDFEGHKNTVDHKKNYVMSFLPKKRKKKSAVEEKKTVNPKDRKCDICDRWFTKFHYPRHMQTQHKVKMETTRSTVKKECTICKKMFHPVALNRHMKKAHCDEKDLPPKVKLECPICKKLFSKDFYPLHMQRHNQGDSRNYICDQCGKKFFFKSTFYTHRLIHSNDLPHKCEYCPYRGRTKGLLKTHVRTHTGDYPYKCTQCDTKCLTKSNLNAHMQRHRGPVDFICDSCNRGFYSKRDLERHIAVIHMGIKNHICNICGMAFGYRHGLMSHQLNVHKRAKGVGKAKAVYLKLEEEGVIPTQQNPAHTAVIPMPMPMTHQPS